jgi:hypothetical protein
VVDDALIDDAVAAIEAKDWARLRLLLHPYVHWSDAAGEVRGRTNALTHLAKGHAVDAPPARYEIRDGQIYRWTA